MQFFLKPCFFGISLLLFLGVSCSSNNDTLITEPIIIPPKGSDLYNDFNGKTKANLDDLEPVMFYDVFGHITSNSDVHYTKDDSEAIKKYFEGIFSGTAISTYYHYRYGVHSFKGTTYAGQSYCFTGYNLKGKRLFTPLCGNISDDGTEEKILSFNTYSNEMLFFGYIGSSINDATEFFSLPPFHVGIWIH